MESAGTTPAPRIPLDDLAALTTADGPFATVLLATESAVENAAQQSLSHWRAASQQLAEAGAPPEVLDAIEPLVPDAHLEGQTLAVVASAVDGVLWVGHHHELPAADEARWASLPAVVPMIAWRQGAIPHVVVTVDRTGADLVGVGYGLEVEREVSGSAEVLRKPNAGGWSQRRFQQRAEHSWEQNAEDVAKEVTRLVERIGARLVVVAGDVRAVQLLRDALPAEVSGLIEEIDGGRAAGVDAELMADDVRRLVQTVAASDTVGVLGKFKEELGQDDRACNGIGETVAALTRAQVDVLLVPEGVAGDETLWFGPDPTQLGHSEAEVAALGAAEAQQGPLVDVLVRAALATGASVRVVPAAGGPVEPVGAILRWSD